LPTTTTSTQTAVRQFVAHVEMLVAVAHAAAAV
jgi:hypothetical protein